MKSIVLTIRPQPSVHSEVKSKMFIDNKNHPSVQSVLRTELSEITKSILMALYLKQDFCPPVLSRKWIAMKFRPNMQIYSKDHVVSILESGLLFREDSIEVEQETMGGEWGGGGWFTRGERVLGAASVCVCLAACPPKALNRTTLFYVGAYLSLPVAIRYGHRRMCRGTLPTLLGLMRDYLTLARRTAACLKECKALRAELGSVSTILESTRMMLCRQQSSLAVTLSRATAALLGNAPWLRGDLAWDAVGDGGDLGDLMKIHHAFLVVQSTMLKHLAMAHFIPSANARRLYKNHNERIYWIHYTLINHLTEEFAQNIDSLQRMYRLLKNYGNNDSYAMKKPGSAINDSWLYSDVHSDIARANLELKMAVNKCNELDLFLDSCALNKQELDLEVLSKDIDSLIGSITKCLATTQSSQIRLKKLLNKFASNETHLQEDETIETGNILKIEDRNPETKDEVFYFVNTGGDDFSGQPSSDVTTGPGKTERAATKLVLNELRRKLVVREDVMRERERQALVKTMPEFKNNVPEFPRQINVDVLDRKGFISKLLKKQSRKKLFRNYKIRSRMPNSNYRNCKLKTNFYATETEIKPPLYEANSKLNLKSKKVTFSKSKTGTFLTKWHRNWKDNANNEFSDLSEGLSDVEAVALNKSVNESLNLNNSYKIEQHGDARNYKFSKKDLELSPSSTDTESDFESYKQRQMALLKDIRKNRVARKKNYTANKAGNTSNDKTMDEGLRPVEYSFGAGLAMASVLQVNSAHRGVTPQEEVFVGDGELSEDSGNDDV